MPIPEYIRQLRQHVGTAPLFVPAITALVFNDANEVLLNRRTDTGKWAVIGGILEPGESPAVGAVREVLEETGLVVAIERVVGVYGWPLVTYPNGDQMSFVSTSFRLRVISGTPYVADDESTDVGFFALDSLPEELSPIHRQRILDGAEPGTHQPALYA